MWFDVQDENGIWRIGYCKQPQKNPLKVTLDGFHPNYSAYYCKHNDKIINIRNKTMGLTIPSTSQTIREILTKQELQKFNNRLTLYLMKQNFLDMTQIDIQILFRTQFLILIDKIINTPFELISQISMVELTLNKIFINLINLYLRLLQQCKKVLTEIRNNRIIEQLYKSTYQIVISISMIMGLNKRSRLFYQNKANIFLKQSGFIDCFLKSEGLKILRHFLKKAKKIAQLSIFDVEICLESINFYLQLSDKTIDDYPEIKGQFILVLDEIIDYIKTIVNKSKDIYQFIMKNIIIIKIQTNFIKLKSKQQQCTIRKYLENVFKNNNNDISAITIQVQQQQNNRIVNLEQRINNIQSILSPFKYKQSNHKNKQISIQQKQPTENLGQQAFLASLEWALESGDIKICKKIVQWRKSLLKLGRIVGWQVAISVGKKTCRKMQINYEDIIETNLQYLQNQTMIKQ